MTNGESVHPTGGVSGSEPTVGSGPDATEEEGTATQETKDFICPYCRRPIPSQSDAEEGDQEEGSAEAPDNRPLEKGITGREEADGRTASDAETE